jgi:C-terminal processing protease CtpA/Prc
MRLAACLVLLASCASSPVHPPSAPAPAPVSASPPTAPKDSTEALAPHPAEQEPAPQAPLDPRTARLVRLCHLWGDVRFLDPWVVSGSVDWDAALESALPKALDAKTDDDEAAAIRALFDPMHDPATFVERRTEPAPPASQHSTETRIVDGVLVVSLGDVPNRSEVDAVAKRLSGELAKVKAAVLDLRSVSDQTAWQVLKDLEPALVTHEGTGVLAFRTVEHHGYRPQSGMTSGGYRTLYVSGQPDLYRAKRRDPLRVTFVAKGSSGAPDIAWAMQRTGDAAVMIQGPLSPDAFVWTKDVPLGGPWVAHIRESTLVGATPAPDATFAATAPDAKIIDAAVRAAKLPRAARRTGAVAAPSGDAIPAWHPEATYADAPYPSRERRLLGLFRLWNVIARFYPYLHLMDDGAWDRALVDLLPRFESASDAREYALAIAEMAARIPDGHVHVWGSPALSSVFGKAFAPLSTQVIEGQVVVTGLPEKSPPAGIAVGDVIVAVGGEPIESAMKRARKYIAGSNESYLAARAAAVALSGSLTDPLVLTLRDASGASRDVSVQRTDVWSVARSGPVYRLIDGDTGYVDLDRLETSDVDAMFTAFEKTKAIIFDMRGYPHGTAWAIAPRLNVRHAKFFAQFFEPLVGPSTDWARSASTYFEQTLERSEKPLYRGQTVMLIDERTMSQAEHTGLFFEAANGTRFVGSQTAGANGDVTNLVLPGGIYVSFGGHDVRHADGRQLQRTGLVPDVFVRPTIAGIRAGRDEVLERALDYLRTSE